MIDVNKAVINKTSDLISNNESCCWNSCDEISRCNCFCAICEKLNSFCKESSNCIGKYCSASLECLGKCLESNGKFLCSLISGCGNCAKAAAECIGQCCSQIDLGDLCECFAKNIGVICECFCQILVAFLG